MRLGQDLVHRILEGVPVKSLLRFTVSKTLKIMIESQYFKERHVIRRQSQEPQILQIDFRDADSNCISDDHDEYIIRTLVLSSFDKMVDESFQVESEFRLKMKFYLVTRSCDGIVCTYNVRNMLLLNPSTRWMRKIPLASIQSDCRWSLCYNFVLGFGKDICTKTYKLVWFYNSKISEDVQGTHCEVFDFNINIWRRVETSHYQILPYQFPVYVDGSLHWLILENNTKIKIVSFDCHTEIFQVISELPISRKDETRIVKAIINNVDGKIPIVMCNMDNRLCVSQKKWPKQYIWTLNCSNMTWEKIFSLDLSSFTHDLSINKIWPIAILKNKKLILRFGYHANTVIYDLETKLYSQSLISIT